MGVLKKLDILDNLYIEDSTDIDANNLATLLGVKQNELAKALDMQASNLSANGISSNNETMKMWMVIFNQLIDIFKREEPGLKKEEIQLKISRWLRLPNSHFSHKTTLDMMLSGKARKVIKFLEQITP